MRVDRPIYMRGFTPLSPRFAPRLRRYRAYMNEHAVLETGHYPRAR